MKNIYERGRESRTLQENIQKVDAKIKISEA